MTSAHLRWHITLAAIALRVAFADGAASISWLSVIGLLLTAAVPAASQTPTAASTNKCAVCHLRTVATRSWITHVDEWVTSKHAWYRVGCEKCHGGDATTSDSAVAHRGVTNSSDASSTVHRRSLPATCGGCHAGEANAFAQSFHEELLSEGEPMAPTCTSCHSSMAADVPSPAVLERGCLACHSADQSNRARVASAQLQDLANLQRSFKRAQFEIGAVIDPVHRNALTELGTDASLSIRAVITGMHTFDLPRVDDRLSKARADIDSLLSKIEKRR